MIKTYANQLPVDQMGVSTSHPRPGSHLHVFVQLNDTSEFAGPDMSDVRATAAEPANVGV